ncbi:MAG: hypothetical protein ABIC40_02480, partial [bacterium]
MSNGKIFTTIAIAIAITLIFGISCGGGNNAASPITTGASQTDSGNAITQAVSQESKTHNLWGYWEIRVDKETLQYEIVPIRITSTHWNVLKWLEQGTCTDCVEIISIHPSGMGTVYVTLQIKHPFPSPKLTGFDVRGIPIFNATHVFPVSGLVMADRAAGDGELVNADGYTNLYYGATAGEGPGGLQGYIKGKIATTTVPDATLNGFKRHNSPGYDNTRNAFYAGDAVMAEYEIDMPDGAWVFGYAVDASWAPAVTQPVTNPITDFGPDANCPEAWQILVYQSNVGGGLSSYGGAVKLMIECFDWQGKDDLHFPVIECPELFNTPVKGYFFEDGAGFTQYEAIVPNTNLAPAGTYSCLVSKEAQENDPVKPWLNLTAFQVVKLEVKGQYVDITPPHLNFSPADVAVDGNYAFVAAGINGLHIFDISDPLNPVWYNRLDLNGKIESVYTSGGYAYVTDFYNGLQIIDIDPIEDAHAVKTVFFFGNCADIVVDGGYAYIAEWDFGLRIVDVDPIETAELVNTIDTPGFGQNVTVSGGYAYFADGDAGLEIIDVDPVETASLVKTVDTPVYAYDIAVAGTYAYVADNYGGLVVIDISVPASAVIINTVNTGSNIMGVAVDGNYAYLAVPSLGLQIIDIST